MRHIICTHIKTNLAIFSISNLQSLSAINFTCFSCDDLDSRLDSQELAVPQAMVSLHLEMAPTYFVDKWGLVDVGQLGPAVRLGWFLPSRTEQSYPPLYDHWKVFRDLSEVSPFLLTRQQEDFIREKVKRGNGR